MKIRRLQSLLLGLPLAIVLAGCIDDQFGPPPPREIPIGTPLTIFQLRQLCPPGNVHTFKGDTSVFAVVTMDDKSGNIYKEAYIGDATGGVVVRLKSPGGLYQGDSMYINLNGISIKYYRKLFQIDSVDVDRNIKKISTLKPTTPKTVTIPELNTFNYESQLIRLENVQFVKSDTSKTWADAEHQEYGELTLMDNMGNAVMVRTSGYAKFASEKVPRGQGSLIAIAGRYDDKVQLIIRRTSEVNFDNPWWDPFDGLTKITIAQLKQKYTGGFPTIHDPNYIEAVVVADDESGNYYKNLVIQDETTGIDLKIDAKDLYKQFPVGARIKVRVKDLILGAYGGLVQLGGSVYQSGGFNRLGGIEEGAIPAYIQLVSLGNEIEPTPIGLVGINDQNLGKLIVLNGVQFDNSELGKPWADNSATTNRTLTDCDGHQIVVRTSNFADFHEELLPEGNGTMIAILSKYLTTYQLYVRNLDDVDLTGERCTLVEPFFVENFTSDLGQFKTFSITGAQTWQWQSYDSGCAYISGFQGGNKENEDWLVSPAIDLEDKVDVRMNIREAINFITSYSDLKVMVSSNYDGVSRPTESGTWVELTGFNRPPGNGWTFVDSGNIDLSQYDGQNIYVAFKYTSSTSGAATWEVGKVVLSGLSLK